MTLSKITRGHSIDIMMLTLFEDLLFCRMFPRAFRKQYSDTQPSYYETNQHDIHKVSSQDVLVQ